MNAPGMIGAAGAISFAGNFKETGGFPTAGYSIIPATCVLAFLASFADNGRLAGPVRAAAGLMLLVAVIRYVPTLYVPEKGRK